MSGAGNGVGYVVGLIVVEEMYDSEMIKRSRILHALNIKHLVMDQAYCSQVSTWEAAAGYQTAYQD